MFSVSDLPAVNATLNGISAVLVVAGFIAIKNGRRDLHKGLQVLIGVLLFYRHAPQFRQFQYAHTLVRGVQRYKTAPHEHLHVQLGAGRAAREHINARMQLGQQLGLHFLSFAASAELRHHCQHQYLVAETR